MEIFGYKVDLHINIWQRVDVLVHAGTKEEADARIIKLVKENPLSLDNGDENIEEMPMNTFVIQSHCLKVQRQHLQSKCTMPIVESLRLKTLSIRT